MTIDARFETYRTVAYDTIRNEGLSSYREPALNWHSLIVTTSGEQLGGVGMPLDTLDLHREQFKGDSRVKKSLEK